MCGIMIEEYFILSEKLLDPTVILTGFETLYVYVICDDGKV
jgi:hypothetical protein